jgi:thiamine-phosphate pyrophosphorylase
MLFDEARRFARTSVSLLISARVDVAMAAGAAGVHLPEGGLAPSEVRALWPDALIGVSRHDRAGLTQVEGADYATLSPFAPTPGKGPALPLETFRQAAEASPVPVLALGGVHAGNTETALRAGAQGVAFIRAAQGTDAAAMRAAVLETSERIRAVSRELDPASNLGE